MSQDQVGDLLSKADKLDAIGIIKLAYEHFDQHVSFATSLGEEDQVILHMISQIAPNMPIFTLDTGRLFPETYELMEKNRKRYPQLRIQTFYPNTQAVEEMVNTKGINLFYESVDNRKLCCQVRKVEPLKRALKNQQAWMVGLRRDQSVTRTDLKAIEWDEGNAKVKFNPLISWSLDDVRAYIKDNHIDINPLHHKGFVSIGCAPCTRAISAGEDIRAGRWWWENPQQKECGLHANPKWKGSKK